MVRARAKSDNEKTIAAVYQMRTAHYNTKVTQSYTHTLCQYCHHVLICEFKGLVDKDLDTGAVLPTVQSLTEALNFLLEKEFDLMHKTLATLLGVYCSSVVPKSVDDILGLHERLTRFSTHITSYASASYRKNISIGVPSSDKIRRIVESVFLSSVVRPSREIGNFDKAFPSVRALSGQELSLDIVSEWDRLRNLTSLLVLLENNADAQSVGRESESHPTSDRVEQEPQFRIRTFPSEQGANESENFCLEGTTAAMPTSNLPAASAFQSNREAISQNIASPERTIRTEYERIIELPFLDHLTELLFQERSKILTFSNANHVRTFLEMYFCVASHLDKLVFTSLKQSSRPKIQSVCVDTLLKPHLSTIIAHGVNALKGKDFSLWDKIQKAAQLCLQESYLSTKIYETMKSEATEKLSFVQTDKKAVVCTVLTYHTILEEGTRRASFSQDMLNVLQKLLHVIVNELSTSFSEALCHTLLTDFGIVSDVHAGTTDSSNALILEMQFKPGSESSANLKSSVQLITYVQNKDSFEEMLHEEAVRLLLSMWSRSTANANVEVLARSVDGLARLLADLEDNVSQQCLFHLQTVIYDVACALVESPLQSDYCHFVTTPAKFLVATTGCWPNLSESEYSGALVAPELMKSYSDFTLRYQLKYSGRKLVLLPNSGIVELSAFGGAVSIYCTTLQASVLLTCFNNSLECASHSPNTPEIISKSYVQERCSLTPGEASSLLDQLVACGMLEKLFEDSCSDINSYYRIASEAPSCWPRKYFLPRLLSPQNQEYECPESLNKHERMIEDRRHTIRALIISLAKKAKLISQQEILNHVKDNTCHRFIVQSEFVLHCVEQLIQQEFLHREKMRPGFYAYLE